ncbi:MAG: class I SAM-dependent methyltransferase, partial [Actinobacteria bacterium]|nr:class I SAM-dependent methyltransferase [Actinomycetota bacterium]
VAGQALEKHNTYAGLFAELGPPGIAVFLALLAAGFRALVRVRRRAIDSEEVALADGLFAALAGTVVIAGFTEADRQVFLWWILGLAFGLAAAQASAPEPQAVARGGEGGGGRWERFAREDAESYILTERARGASAHDSSFFASGRRDVDRMLVEVDGLLERTGVAVEIGCGVGRLTIPIARKFESVAAVDIAPTMLAKLMRNCEREGVSNVRAFAPDEDWDAVRADFVYSRLVFQHLDESDEIREYLRRIAGALAENGVAHLQFDTRPASAAYMIRNRLPDAVLPRTWRRGIRRIRRSPDELYLFFADCGLEVVRELRPGTEDHVFIVKNAVRPSR